MSAFLEMSSDDHLYHFGTLYAIHKIIYHDYVVKKTTLNRQLETKSRSRETGYKCFPMVQLRDEGSQEVQTSIHHPMDIYTLAIWDL